MKLLELIKALIGGRKKVSSLDLGKPDLAYEVWELGRMIAKILEVCWLIRPPIKEAREEGFLIRDAGDSICCLKVLYKNLEESKILGKMEELKERIEEISTRDILKSFKSEDVKAIVERIEVLIGYELIARSAHLFNIFSFSLNLRRLKTKLLYGLSLKDELIKNHIKQSIGLLEKIRLGDKILVSPKLELTKQNLMIIKYRLDGWLKFLPELREHSKSIIPYSTEERLFLKKVGDECDIWTELILDIKNPSNNLSFKRKFIIGIISFGFFYYMIVFPLIFWNDLMDFFLKELSLERKELSATIFPLWLYLGYWLYTRLKDWLIKTSFKFKLSDFKE
ncbi:MAG: hypothetical protein V2A53_09810 [bacterium]